MRRPPHMVGRCEYFEQTFAHKRKLVVVQPGNWSRS